MLPIWHAIVAGLHWLHANIAFVWVSAVLTAIGTGIMWPLILRKTRLEIEHLRLDTKRLELEVQKLADEKTQRDAAKTVASRCERIVGLAKEYTKRNPGWDRLLRLQKTHFVLELGESQEAIVTALKKLQSQGHAEYRGQLKRWIITV